MEKLSQTQKTVKEIVVKFLKDRKGRPFFIYNLYKYAIRVHDSHLKYNTFYRECWRLEKDGKLGMMKSGFDNLYKEKLELSFFQKVSDWFFGQN